MIDKTMAEIIGQLAGSASLCWEPKPTGVFDSESAAKFVNEALTAIYEIGLECIGADEEIDYDGSEPIWRKAKARNDLRASQRKAWAKACGVDNE